MLHNLPYVMLLEGVKVRIRRDVVCLQSQTITTEPCHNFMCRFDWDMGHPDIWLNIAVGESVRVSGRD